MGARVIAVLVALAAAACVEHAAAPGTAPVQTATSSPSPAIPVKIETAEVTFIDDSTFDDQLSDALRRDTQQVDVVAPERFGLNKIPDRLEKWLTEVKDSGGKVKAQPLPAGNEVATRGVVDMAIDLVVSIVQGVRARHLYAPSHDYDVYLLYRKDTGIVEETRFVRRGS